MASDLSDQFRKVDVGEYPDVHRLTDDFDVALWVMLVGLEKLGLSAMTGPEIADVATHVYLRPLTRQRICSLLASTNGEVIRKARSSPARYTLMRAGMDRIRAQGVSVIVVDPAAALTAQMQLEQILNVVDGDVLLCDPYVDDKTLLVLTSIPKASGIKLLTLNVQDAAKFRQRLTAYSKEYGNLEVRVSAVADLHDRYLIDTKKMWLVGQSLNGIGKKQSFMVTVGPDVRALTEQGFMKRWNQSPRWN